MRRFLQHAERFLQTNVEDIHHSEVLACRAHVRERFQRVSDAFTEYQAQLSHALGMAQDKDKTVRDGQYQISILPTVQRHACISTRHLICSQEASKQMRLEGRALPGPIQR